MFKVVGEEAAKLGERRNVINYSVQGAFYLAATIISGIAIFGDDEESTTVEGGYDRMLSSVANICSRVLAVPDQSVQPDASRTNTPILLCLAGWIFNVVFIIVRTWLFYPPDGDHRKYTVPMNVEYVIHRFGELTMLLLGESILSLLIVGTTPTLEYNIAFYAGIISVILIQYLHFKYAPHSADEHAFRRSVKAGVIYYVLTIIHSFALVAMV